MSVRIFHSLKFQIVGLAVLTGLAAAVGTATLVLGVTESELQSQLLDSERSDRQRTAALLSTKLLTLESALMAMARHVDAARWQDPQAMAAYLEDKPGLVALFDNVLAAGADGRTLARLEHGKPAVERPSIADRDYFKRAMTGSEPVISDPLVGKISKAPLLVLAVPVPGPAGGNVGIFAGTVRLQSNNLFADPVAADHTGTRDLVVDGKGMVLSHANPARVMQRADTEPGLSPVLARWTHGGKRIDVHGVAEFTNDHLVSLASIPKTDWVLVRLVPRSEALGSLTAARHSAWSATLLAGGLAALLAGAVAWLAVRPIEQLKQRAEHLLADDDESAGGEWQSATGEVGALSQAFQLLLQHRSRQRHELQAVLDNAEVGLALSRNGQFDMVSRPFCALFGCVANDLLGHPTRTIYGSDAAYEAFSAVATPAFMQCGQFDGEVQLQRRDGSPFWARMRGRALVPGDRSHGTIWVVADVTQEREQRERLGWDASHDLLTGLTNRAGFETLLEAASAAAAQAPFCALFIDLDRFKQVNDSGGHSAGDALLSGLARELVAQVRKTDTVARLGGDEFAVLMPDCPLPRAQQLAEAIRQAVERYRLPWGGQTFSVGVSVGLVAADGSHANAAAVLKAADAACYAAKRAGRNQVALAEA